MEKGLEKAGWSASTLCRNDNNGNVCRRSTGASAVYGGSNGDTIGKGGAANVQLSIEEYLKECWKNKQEVIDVSAYKLNEED